MCFTRVSASVETAFEFSLVWCHNACVSHACLHLLRRLSRFFFGMGSQCMRFTRLSASIKTAFAFFFVSRYNACISHACLHRLRRLLTFPWYGVTMHAFHTHVCIYYDGFRVLLGMVSQCMRFTRLSASFLGMALQCMRFTRVSASVKTAFAFFLVWRQSTCVLHA